MVRSLTRKRNWPGEGEAPPNGAVEPRKNVFKAELAEIGPDMSQFPSVRHISSCGGVCLKGEILAYHNQIGWKASARHRGSRAYGAEFGVRSATDTRAVSGKEGDRP